MDKERNTKITQQDPPRVVTFGEILLRLSAPGYERLRGQFEQVREAYPQAELAQELDDPAFMRLVVRGVDARSAYELTHLQELRKSAVAYGARRAREELTAAMQAGYLRPREGGMAQSGCGAFAESPEQWSRKTREELKTRARRGEKVCL